MLRLSLTQSCSEAGSEAATDALSGSSYEPGPGAMLLAQLHAEARAEATSGAGLEAMCEAEATSEAGTEGVPCNPGWHVMPKSQALAQHHSGSDTLYMVHCAWYAPCMIRQFGD